MQEDDKTKMQLKLANCDTHIRKVIKYLTRCYAAGMLRAAGCYARLHSQLNVPSTFKAVSFFLDTSCHWKQTLFYWLEQDVDKQKLGSRRSKVTKHPGRVPAQAKGREGRPAPSGIMHSQVYCTYNMDTSNSISSQRKWTTMSILTEKMNYCSDKTER